MQGPLSMAKPALCAKIPALLIPKKSACRWTNGRFVSMMSIQRISAGKRLNTFRTCWLTTTPPTIATNHEGCRVMALPSCMGWSTVESAGTKWSRSHKHGTRYLCNYLRQQYHVPVCQYIPADPVDVQVVEAFFQALSPVELDIYAAAVATQQAMAQQIAHAHQQHIERLRYEATIAGRQFNRVDPDNRLVAAELEKRWEGALADLKSAEEAQASQGPAPTSLQALSSALQTAFQAIGQHLPMVF